MTTEISNEVPNNKKDDPIFQQSIDPALRLPIPRSVRYVAHMNPMNIDPVWFIPGLMIVCVILFISALESHLPISELNLSIWELSWLLYCPGAAVVLFIDLMWRVQAKKLVTTGTPVTGVICPVSGPLSGFSLIDEMIVGFLVPWLFWRELIQVRYTLNGVAYEKIIWISRRGQEINLGAPVTVLVDEVNPKKILLYKCAPYQVQTGP